MSTRPITMKGKARLVNEIRRAQRKAQREAGIAIEQRVAGFYSLPSEERIAWLGVVDWHLNQLAKA